MVKRREFIGCGAALGTAWLLGCEGGTENADSGGSPNGAGGNGSGGSPNASGGAPASGGDSAEGGFAGAGSCGRVETDIAAPHPHELTITAAEVLLGAAHYYTITGAHTHGLSLTAADFHALGQGETVVKTSGEGGYGDATHSHQVTVRCVG